LNLVMIMAAMVPNATETVAETAATFMLVIAALNIIGSDSKALYHFSENPVHETTSLDSLKE
jgi:hypothetical protein